MQSLVEMLTGKADTWRLLLVKMLTDNADTWRQGGRMQSPVEMPSGKADTLHLGGRMQSLVKMLTVKADTWRRFLVKMLTGKADTLHQGGRMQILVEMPSGKADTLHLGVKRTDALIRGAPQGWGSAHGRPCLWLHDSRALCTGRGLGLTGRRCRKCHA
jgi:hypothetical protein